MSLISIYSRITTKQPQPQQRQPHPRAQPAALRQFDRAEAALAAAGHSAHASERTTAAASAVLADESIAFGGRKQQRRRRRREMRRSELLALAGTFAAHSFRQCIKALSLMEKHTRDAQFQLGRRT